MPENKIAAPVLEHRDGKTKDIIASIIPLARRGIKCAATFAALVLAICALCGLVGLAEGGGCAAAAGTLAAVVSMNAALGLREVMVERWESRKN